MFFFGPGAGAGATITSAVVADILNIVAVLKTGLTQTQSAGTRPPSAFGLFAHPALLMAPMVTRFTPVPDTKPAR